MSLCTLSEASAMYLQKLLTMRHLLFQTRTLWNLHQVWHILSRQYFQRQYFQSSGHGISHLRAISSPLWCTSLSSHTLYVFVSSQIKNDDGLIVELHLYSVLSYLYCFSCSFMGGMKKQRQVSCKFIRPMDSNLPTMCLTKFWRIWGCKTDPENFVPLPEKAQFWRVCMSLRDYDKVSILHQCIL